MSGKRILFAVHRGYPFPGGSEYYVHQMSEEARSRGHDVTVLAHTIDPNTPYYTNDYQILMQNWDAIVVHGCDVITQNIVHSNTQVIPCKKIIYMIILPSESNVAKHAMKYSDVLAYSTIEDLEHIKLHGYEQKARRIRHGTIVSNHITNPYRDHTKPNYVSVGGFSLHKGMVELSGIFSEFKNSRLHLYGYSGGEGLTLLNNHLNHLSRNIIINTNTPHYEILGAIHHADAYIMNSYQEGFGMVLLEAMFLKTPVISRNIAGARILKDYILTYDSPNELREILETESWRNLDVEKAYEYVSGNHHIRNTINDLEDIINE